MKYKLYKRTGLNKLSIQLKMFVEQAVEEANKINESDNVLYQKINTEIGRLHHLYPRTAEPFVHVWHNPTTDLFNVTIYPSVKHYQSSQGYLLAISQQKIG